jgi:hypothetical protein
MVTWGRRRRPATPRQTLLAGALMLVVAVGFTVTGAHKAQRSSTTQHAVAVVAQVVADDETHHSSRSGSYWTSAYEVREPSGVLVWARSHGRKDDALVGRALRVVVDPQDPNSGSSDPSVGGWRAVKGAHAASALGFWLV